MKKIILSIIIILFTYNVSFSDNRKHYYGEWTSGNELTFIYNISVNSLKSEVVEYTSLGIPLKTDQPILKWELAKNLNKTLNANYPDGYLVRTKRGDGSPTYFYLWRHYKNNNTIMFQPEEFFLEGKYDILNRIVSFKQADYYGKWNPTDGVSIDRGSVVTISANAIKYQSFEQSGEPVIINFPILRWEFIENPDKSSIADFPDGYIVSTESTGGYPKTIFLWRKSKDTDMILFQPLESEGSLFLVRAKNN
jgi:hypothetical protein